MNHMHFFPWDERRDIANPGNREKTLAFSVEHFLNCAKEGMKMHGHFAVALSGGSTPRAIFQALSKPPYANGIDWTKVLLFWGDERHVPPTDPDSNFRMAIEAGFKNLPIPATQIFRMQAEKNLETNALRYEAKIKEILGIRPFDLIMLGMGQDGHIASLFPQTTALKETKRWVVANYVPSKNTWRMTFTYPLINRGGNIVIYVLGEHKQKVVHNIFLGQQIPPLPAALVGTRENKALWILDKNAFGNLGQAKTREED